MPPRASLKPKVGNSYDKYATSNPLAAKLTGRFLDELDALVAAVSPTTVLDVGCGEGVVAQRVAAAPSAPQVLAVDREALQEEWSRRSGPRLSFAVADARALPYDDGAFDLVLGIELLEQVQPAEEALRELVRVASRGVIVSVPREPVWRVLNVLRGAYVRWLGNPPGHVNHYSKRSFVALTSAHGAPRAVRSPFPWTIVALDK